MTSRRARVRLVTAAAVLTAASACTTTTEDREPSPTPGGSGSPGGALAFEAGECGRLGLSDTATDLDADLEPLTTPVEEVRATDDGQLLSCSGLWRDPEGQVRQAELALVVERFDEPGDLDRRWEDARQSPVELVDVAGSSDPVPLTTRPPVGPWDEAVAGALARTTSGSGPTGDGEVAQVLLRTWVRQGDALLDASLTYEVPTAATSPEMALAQMQTVVDDLLARVVSD